MGADRRRSKQGDSTPQTAVTAAMEGQKHRWLTPSASPAASGECPQYNCESPWASCPDCITAQFDGVFQGVTPSRVVYISLGLFTIDADRALCPDDDPRLRLLRAG